VKIDAETLNRVRERSEELKTRLATADAKHAKPSAKAWKRREHPFVQVPLHWVPIIQRAKAESAMLLLLATAYQMHMDQKSRVPITAATWALAGDPRTEAQRRVAIKVLRRIPSIVQLTYSQHTGPKYTAIKGRWWGKAPPQVCEDDGDEEPSDVGRYT
jgi:hypothetical protein